MATAEAGQEGMTGEDNDQTFTARGIGQLYLPTSYNQTSITIYKMMGKCSIDGWDYWENNSGDEAGRTVHGTQEAGTVVAKRVVPQGL